MTVRKVWLGSTGPFLYDDSVLYIDEDGIISPDNQQAIATDGQIVIQSAPSSPVHAVRKQDLDDAVGDISGLQSQIAALATRVTTLEGKLTTGSFTAEYLGFVGSPRTYTARYSQLDRVVMMELPGFTGTSDAASIVIRNIPVALIGTAGYTQWPVLVNMTPEGQDWARATINTGGGFISISPVVKRSAFASGTITSLYNAYIIWKQD